jgi:hypothetical protein
MRSLLAAGCSTFALLVAAPTAWAQGWGAQGGAQVGTSGASYSYSGPAAPATHATFGLANQFVLSSNLGTGFTYTTRSKGDAPGSGGDSDFALQLGSDLGQAWALDYFVIDNLSIGGQISYASNNDGATKNLSIAPRLGYNLAFSDDFSLWLQAGVAYASTKTEDSAGADVKGSSFGLALNAPFLYHITNHFFLGAGPFASTELGNSAKVGGGASVDNPKSTSFGLLTLLGGYI